MKCDFRFALKANDMMWQLCAAGRMPKGDTQGLTSMTH